MEAIYGFEPFGFIAGVMTKPFYVWGIVGGVKTLIKEPTIPSLDPNNPTTIAYNPNHKLISKDTIEEVFTDFDNEGFTLPEKDVWDFPERPIRIFMLNDNYVELIADPANRGLLHYYDLNVDFAVKRNGGQFLYLKQLREEHRLILIQFNAVIENIAG